MFFWYQMTFCRWKQRISCFREVNRFQAVNFPPVFNWTVWEGVFHPQAATKTLEPWDKGNRKTGVNIKPYNSHSFCGKFSLRSPAHGFFAWISTTNLQKTHLTRQFPPFLCVYPQTFRCVFFFVLPLEVKMMNSSLQAGLAKADDVLARGQQAFDGWGDLEVYWWRWLFPLVG